MYIYIHICVYIYIYIYTYTHTLTKLTHFALYQKLTPCQFTVLQFKKKKLLTETKNNVD